MPRSLIEANKSMTISWCGPAEAFLSCCTSSLLGMIVAYRSNMSLSVIFEICLKPVFIQAPFKTSQIKRLRYPSNYPESHYILSQCQYLRSLPPCHSMLEILDLVNTPCDESPTLARVHYTPIFQHRQ